MTRGRGPGRPARHRLAAVCIGAAVLLAGCGAGSAGSLTVTPGPGATASLVPADTATPAPSGPVPATPVPSLASPVTGVITHVDLAGLGKVTAFTMLVPGGEQVTFTMGVQENAAEFPAAHLSEHLASSEPVRVFFRTQGASLVVYRLEDASGASPAAS